MENDIEWINPAERLPQAGQKVIARDMANGIKICTFIVARGGGCLWVVTGKTKGRLENVIGWIPWRG